MTDLRKLAEAATPGPWRWDDVMGGVRIEDHYIVSSFGHHNGVPHPDEAYIAAASPDVILALLDELDAWEASSLSWQTHYGEEAVRTEALRAALTAIAETPDLYGEAAGRMREQARAALENAPVVDSVSVDDARQEPK